MSASPALPPSDRWPLALAGAMVLSSVVAVAAYRSFAAPIRPADAPALATRELRFLDRSDGSIEVVDARSGATVTSIVGQSGFVRGTLRGLARERKRQGIGAEPAFDLVAHADGRLTLLDPSTGRRVDLESFGPTNTAEFARLLAEPTAAAATPHPRS